jgi:DNA-binding SARP family transcriptional activator
MSTRGYHLRLLGGAVINVEHDAPAPLAVWRHPLALAAILAADTGETVTRDKLMALLWPEADTERARKRLRVALHALRQALGQDAIVSVADGLRLDTTRVRCDVVDFCSALEAGQPELAVQALSTLWPRRPHLA